MDRNETHVRIVRRCGDGVECCFEFEAGPGTLVSDASALQRVLGHLLRNAAIATRAGRVCLRCAPSADAVLFSVSDTGVGLDATDAATFHRYAQAPPLGETQLSLETVEAVSLTRRLNNGIQISRIQGTFFFF